MAVRSDAGIVSTRRKLLGATGSALLSSLAGCASVVERTADEGTGRTTETTAGTPTTANRNVTRRNVTERNVSDSDDVDGTVDDEPLGRIDIDPPETTVPESLVPEDPDQYEYARLGFEDASATATLYGNWKCPYTREFVLENLSDVIEEFVESGDVALEFRALSYLNEEPFLGDDAPKAAGAALEIWESEPERYWSYFASVFTNQPPERYEWATVDRLARLADAADVEDVDAVEAAVETGDHREAVRATTDRATERGFVTVPRITTDDRVTAPTVDFEATKRQLRRAIAD